MWKKTVDKDWSSLYLNNENAVVYCYEGDP